MSFGESVDELRESLGAAKTIGNALLQNCYAGPYHIDRYTDAGDHDPGMSLLINKRDKKIAKILECFPD